MSDQIKVKQLINELNRRAARAVVSQLSFRSATATNYLRSLFERMPGVEGSFMSDPVIEATFGWKESEKEMGDLKDKLISGPVLDALSNPPKKPEDLSEYEFPIDRHPYVHQIRAWQKLLDDERKSVLVSSGTGSGKTECFLIPIIEDLYTEFNETDANLTGVRALFLYPLNALINSQRERLKAWTHQFDGGLRYCLYNGETPTKRTSASTMRESPEEVRDRTILRENPPPILVTNSTMLEYMLVRNEDAPIIEQSQGKLRWIVLDEVHTYIGSQAAELALLLRRVIDAFGVKSEVVRFVATSATIGGGDEESLTKLQKFLADVAGVDEIKVHVINGERNIPAIVERADKQFPSLDELAAKPDKEKFDLLCGYAPALKIRKILEASPHSATTNELILELKKVWKNITKQDVWELLDCMAAANDGESSFLPIRAHLFQKTLDGIYACTNPDCSHLTDELKDGDWKFGQIYLSERDFCHCGAPVQPIISCNSCGQEYLEAEEGFDTSSEKYVILHPTRHDDEDEFLWDIELDEDEGEPAAVREDAGKEHILIHHQGAENAIPLRVQKNTRELADKDGDIILHRQTIAEANCITCGASDRTGWKAFMPKRLGAPFFLGDSLPTLLEHSPRHGEGPFESRRLLTFTDSRQGTARIAARLQQDIDRNKIRSVIYHSVHADDENSNADEIIKLKSDIEKLEEKPEVAEMMKGFIDNKKVELEILESQNYRVLTWKDAAEYLNNSTDVSRYMFDAFREIASTYIEKEQFGDFCLFREFMRRPRRGFQLETLGMVDVFYPEIETIKEAPAAWQQLYTDQKDKKENALQDWKDWLTIFIDMFLRENSAVEYQEYWGNLMGARFRRKYVVAPNDERTQYLLRWPSARRSTRSKVIALLVRGFNLDTTNTVIDHIEQVLADSWVVIKQKALKSQDESRFLLDLKNSAAFRKLNTGWKCPYTHRVISRLFRGQSPNTPGRDLTALQCREIELPDMPFPFQTDSASRPKIVEWIETDGLLSKARELGVWPNRADRIATGERWYRIAEHSAQIDSKQLKKYEKMFKEGKLNVLSCSTTMEMGVDIGGMSVVAMNNVPPHPANYMQRAGRAGRRKEPTSVCFTLCKNSSHSMQVFNEPKWPFLPGQIEAPRISLESRNIVQRHANALLLSFWLRQFGDDIPKLTSGWFFEKSDKGMAIVDNYIAWCSSITSQPEYKKLSKSMSSITNKTSISSKTLEQITAQSALIIESVYTKWWDEFDPMLDELEKISANKKNPEKEPAYKAVNISLNRMRMEYLLSDLANGGFLPGYGFPTHVVSLNNVTMRELKKGTGNGREDNFGKSRGGPSRDLAVALREYAPGAEIVMKGLVYRSAGITLNWHRPSNLDVAPEIQNLYHHWECKKCGDFGDSHRIPSRCPSCGTNTSYLDIKAVLEPAGFSVDLFEDPHTDVNRPIFMPFEDAKVAAVDAPWRTLPNNLLGKIRYSENGLVSHVSSGMHGNGYTLCLCCGRAEPQHLPGEAVESVLNNHRRLRGGKGGENGSACEGPGNDYMIRRDLFLASKIHTSVFELQLRDPRNEYKPVQDPEIAWTIGFALRNILTKRLGVDQREVEVSVRDIRFDDEKVGFSLCLYDTASQGAGYVERLQDDLITLMKEVINSLDCPVSCDSVCQHCLLDNSSQFKENYLNRAIANEWLTEWLKACTLADDKHYFGSNSSVNLSSLPYQLELLLREQKINRVKMFVEISDEDPANISNWPMLDVTQRLISNNTEVEWILSGVDVESWKERCGSQFAALMGIFEEKLFISHMSVKNELNGPGKMIMAAENGDKGRYWAGDSAVLNLTENWGTLDGPVVTTPEWMDVLEFPVKKLTSESLTPHEKSNSASVRMHGQLDGKVNDFGSNFISWIKNEFPLLGDKINEQVKLESITYSDRYLRAPIHIRLLSGLIASLITACGDDDTAITVFSTVMPDSERIPYKLFHNFIDTHERDEILRKTISELSDNSQISIEAHSSKISHARTLQLMFSDGETFEIDFDQGMGAWQYFGTNWDAHADTESKVESIFKARGTIRISGKWGTSINLRKAG